MARRPLVARFSADTSAFRSELTNARTFATREFGQIASIGTRSFRALEGTSAQSAAAMTSTFARAFMTIKSMSTGLQLAIGAFAVAAAAGAAELEHFHRIAERSRSSGVGTIFFQSFTNSARAFRLEVKELQEDMAGLARALRDTFDGDRAGGVSNRARDLLQERFRGTSDFGMSSAPALFDAARNTEERIRAVLIGLKDMEAAGQRLAAIDMARRLGMDRLAGQVELGRTSFTGFLAEVQRLEATGLRDGSIISPELIRQGEALRDRFAAVGNELSRNVRPILDECARLALAIGNGAAWSAEQFAALVGVVGRVVAALRSATVEANALNGAAARAVRRTPPPARSPEPAIDDHVGQARAAQEAGWGRVRRSVTGRAERAQAELDNEFAREARRGRGLGGLEPRVAGADFSAPVPNPRPVVAPGPSTPSAGAKSTDDWAEAYKRLIASMEKANATAKAELATVGASTAERERATAIAKAEADARKNGKTLTDQQREAIGRLATEHGTLADKIKDAQQAQKGFADALQWTGDQFVDLIANGRSFEDVMKGVRAQTIRAQITGQGPFAQMLGVAPQASAPQGTLGGLMGMFQQQMRPQEMAAPIVAGMGQAAQGMQPLFLNSFSQVATQTQGQFGSVFTGLGSLLQMVMTQAITASQGVGGLGGLGGLLGGLGGGAPVLSPFGIYHGGGTAGDRVSGFAPAGLWNNAPRYHSGLRAGEMRAILNYGERVLTQADSERTMRTMGGLARKASDGGGSGRGRVTINNYAGAQVETREGPDGDLEVMVRAVEAQMGQRVARREGSLYGAIGSSIGNVPGTGLRGV